MTSVRSRPVTAAAPPTLSATPTTVKAGSALTVTWANIPAPTNADLVALYPSASTGDTAHIVIVQTNGGYAPSPGHAGTGTVVAVVC